MKVDTPVTGSVDEATSQTVDICRCLLLLGIVCIHCQIEVPPDAPAWLHDFRYFFQVILPSVCVPGFFVISGCWLFRSYDGSPGQYAGLLKKRVFSLVIPYLFWNLAVFLLYWLAPKIPGISAFFTNDKFAGRSPLMVLDLLFGVTEKPIAYQFWFIRNLFLYAALTPLLYLLFRLPLGVFLCLISIFFICSPHIGGGLFFLLAGGILARLDIVRRISWKNHYCRFLSVLFLFLSILALNRTGGMRLAVILSGIPSVYCLSAFLYRIPWMSRFFRYLKTGVFFIFGIHAVLIVLIVKMFFLFIPASACGIVIGTLLCPLLCIGISLLIFEIFRKLFPRLLGVICGGRI